MSEAQANRFDYITAQPYRVLLEADFAEMQACLEARAWKAAMVLAGSLIEAVLVEHLEWLSPETEAVRIRKLMLQQVISECEDQHVITETTAKLCSAIKDYRNLIHPGKVVRDSVAAPDQSNALIVTALVGRIVLEVAASRKAKAGLTAEQLLRKIQRDGGSIAILPHLLRDIADKEKQRLMLDVLPKAYAESLIYDDFEWDAALPERISAAYRLAIKENPELAGVTTLQFYTLIRNGEATEIARHRTAFFRPTDLEHLDELKRPVVIDYLIGFLIEQGDSIPFGELAGIGPFLTVETLPKFLSPMLRYIRAAKASTLAVRYVANELARLPEDVKPSAREQITRLISTHKNRGNSKHATELEELIEWIDIPF